jgi:hypothetical protein
VTPQALLTRIALAIALGVCVATAGAVLWHHYSDLVDTKAALTGQVSGLQADVARESARGNALETTVGKWAKAAEAQAAALDQLTQAQRESGAYQRELKDVLSKHDLAELARWKPEMVERRINAGTRAALRMLEQSTGKAPAADPGAAAASPGPASSPADQP